MKQTSAYSGNNCEKENKFDNLLTIFRIISLVVLAITLFVSIDLLINFLSALVPSMNDGIGANTIISSVLYFGDNCYSLERFFHYFQTSSLISFAVFVENIVLNIIAIARNRNRIFKEITGTNPAEFRKSAVQKRKDEIK